MPGWMLVPGWLDLLDIALVAGFGWLAIRYFRRAKARVALAGLASIAIVYVLARMLELRLAAVLLQGFFAVVVLVLVVVFQDDLRRVFEQLGGWWRGRPKQPPESEMADLLVRAVARLAATRTGALLVLPGHEPLDRHLEGGVALGGRLSEPLVLSLFDASSPGHDGAVLLRGATVERFAVHLPLSPNRAELGSAGTRHAAALGLAERCDATCIVVSEERGTVSVARDGEIRSLGRPEDLAAELLPTLSDASQQRGWWKGGVGLDAALAVAGAFVLWAVFVPGSDVSEATVTAGVEIANLPEGLVLESIDPSSVDVTLRGQRRDLLLAGRSQISVRLDAYLARLGRRTFSLSAQDVRKPGRVSVVALAPERIRLSVRDTTSPSGPGGS